MARTFHLNLAHIVFSTKHRQPFITAGLEPDLHAYLGGIIRELGGTALCINGMPDHVHILARTPKTSAASDFMRILKTNSSAWAKSACPPFAWQEGYGWFSVSPSQLPSVERYIRGQKEHHRVATFEEELVAFLQRHGIEYDEAHLWD